MIVLDTSAILAILCDEPERADFVRAIAAADRCLISAGTLGEVGIVVAARFGPAGSHYLATLLARAGVETLPVDQAQADAAVVAYRQFGKGRHPAGLNFGDCFSYALARVHDAALLFKGDDFSKTDLAAVNH